MTTKEAQPKAPHRRQPAFALITTYLYALAYRYVNGIATSACMPPQKSASSDEDHSTFWYYADLATSFEQHSSIGHFACTLKTSSTQTEDFASPSSSGCTYDHEIQTRPLAEPTHISTSTNTPTSNNHEYGFRYYDPVTGRWPPRVLVKGGTKPF